MPPNSQTHPELRGFKLVFTGIGILYALMAISMLVRGSGVLRDFGVSERDVTSPVVDDLFTFFYLLMAFVGVLMVLFGHVTRGARAQRIVAAVFSAWSLVTTFRDLSTSDSRFGNHLYQGDKTLVFVYIGLAFAAAFGALLLRRTRARE